ncbi:hypothetical protein [Corallibacter sp.]|uniref:hypothetical protein n=1 Tax=Corallibacter sp. TaxID=2038084 RepID=UPI003A8DDA33
MIKTLFAQLSLILFTTISFSQNLQSDYTESHYLEYFSLEPETIHTQLNKSKYLNSEELWFKSYIYNTKTQKPYLTTTNVYASIYNADGVLIEKKIYYTEHGMTHGNFSFKKNYLPGIYFLKVTTNWMRNFNEPHYSLIQFEIIDSQPKTTNSSNHTSEIKHDFQILPEGGQLVAGNSNSIGFKITDQNEDPLVIISGDVLDSKNNVVTTIKSNAFGIGKFDLNIKPDESYKIKATLKDSTIIEKSIPKANKTGITISTNNLNNETLFITLNTNKNTLPNLINSPYYLLIHRDGFMKRIDVSFSQDKYSYTIAVPKKNLYSGINIITLFNEKNQPVLERLLFKKTKKLISDISIAGTHTGVDSTIVTLKSNKKSGYQKGISISVLPTSTKAYNENHTIAASFYLKPYIKGTIHKPNYYFSSDDRRTNYDLDLLLLTQGWSSYDWKNIFFNPQIAKHNFEAGFQIRGEINAKNKENIKEVVLFSANNKLMLTSKLKNGQFNFDHLFLMDSSIVSISANTNRGKQISPGVYYNTYPTYIIDSINTKKLINKNIISRDLNSFNFIHGDFNLLDTVSISNNYTEKKERYMVNGGVNNRGINLESGYSFTTRVLDVIRNNGFDVIESGASVKILSRRASNLSGRLSPNVYVDGIIISDFLETIQYLTVSEIDELYIARTGFGMDGAGGSINIFTKNSIGLKNNRKSDFKNSKIKIGFSMPKKYYSPFYNKAQEETFSKIGVLHWLPNLKPNKREEFVFKIPNYYYESINLYIEGMNEDGSLISTVKTFQLN